MSFGGWSLTEVCFNYIREILYPDIALLCYYQEFDQESIIIKLGNIQSLPVEILGLKINDTTYVEVSNNILLPAKFKNENINYIKIKFEPVLGNDRIYDNKLGSLIIIYRVFGTDIEREEIVKPYSYTEL